MVFSTNVGKYNLQRTIGEGSFAKVKLASNTETGQFVAIKIIDKQMVMDKKLMDQVIATKTKIYIVMEYVSGGQLSDKMAYTKSLSEDEARKYFQQLIDAVDYCHCRGVYHRDLKPENLLLDYKGNLKVSDFGLSVLKKPGDLLSTSCGSPSYVAPEVITNKSYEGSAADVWSCGVILFELLSGFLPFEDRNLTSLYRKRITVAEILEDEWFQIDYKPSIGIDHEESIILDEFNMASVGESITETHKVKSPSFINAFQLIAMSNDLNLSGLFEEEDNEKLKTRLGSGHSIHETIEKIEVAAKDAQLSVERLNSSKVKLHNTRTLLRCRSNRTLSAEITEVTPTNCVVEIAQSAAELKVYKEFCKSLSSILREKSGTSSEFQKSAPAISIAQNQNTEVEAVKISNEAIRHIDISLPMLSANDTLFHQA
ncbi:CBL-interacting serine/threonine-protein kinase 21 [Asimina triloba]